MLAACVTFLALSGSAGAQTQPLEFKVTVQAETLKGSAGDHFLTFSGPVAIPEVGLAPGTYVFRLVAPSVMQVLSRDRSQLYATFFTVPVSRGEVTDNYEVTMVRVNDLAPVRIVRWFEPNRSSGYELLYRNTIDADISER